MNNARLNIPTVALGTQLGTAIDFVSVARCTPPIMEDVTDRWQDVQQQMFEPYGFTSEHVGAAPRRAELLPAFMRRTVPLLRTVFDNHLLSMRDGWVLLEVAQEEGVTRDLLHEARQAGLVSACVAQFFMCEAAMENSRLVESGKNRASYSEISTWVGGLIAAAGAGMTTAALMSQSSEPVQGAVGIVLTLGGLAAVVFRNAAWLRA